MMFHASSRACRVHPRVCGEARVVEAGIAKVAGPSPRVRGSRSCGAGVVVGAGSIPACAGKPTPTESAACSRGVHPRVCGEAQADWTATTGDAGPSPRVRGSLRRGLPLAGIDGSIPACAGKPGPESHARTEWRVHPRVCGEAEELESVPIDALGPSPRVRGSHAKQQAAEQDRRSIPACAGKPRSNRLDLSDVRVHPRVCGEALSVSLRAACRTGPSPRVRGSPQA